MRVRLGGPVPRIRAGAWLRAFLVIIRLILIQNPFHDVAAHVLETPGVGLFFANFLVLEITVLFVPGVVAQLAGVVAKKVGVGRACATGVLPFRLGGQAVELAGLGAQPLAIFIGAMLGHANSGET